MVSTLKSLLALLPVLALTASANPTKKPVVDPSVTIKNGTVRGVYNSVWEQDYFLGIPYAQPATGNNRFNLPKPIASKWQGAFVADDYGDRCLGLHHPFPNLPESEDCLNLNIVRPVGYKHKKLPVMVWIHGGGFTSSGSSNPPYNMTFLVDQSVKIGKPIIAVSFNYRLAAWGMLASSTLKAAGISNVGLKDQRFALHWIQENIGAFGGDPRKVTIGGDSAGGASVGIQVMAYGGRDDKLFRGAIFNSGGALWMGQYGDLNNMENMYNELVAEVGCSTAADSLACLRQVPTAQIWDAIKLVDSRHVPNSWQYHVDGEFIKELSSISLKNGRFVKVPIMVGATTDEGTYAVGYGTDSEFEIEYVLKAFANPNLSTETVNKILAAYPDDPVVGSPGGSTERFPAPYKSQFKRAASIVGDYFLIAGRRLTARYWAKSGQPVYSWRFNTLPAGVPREYGSTHVTDQAFVFRNLEGVGYPISYMDVEPAWRKARYIETAKLMSGSLISFTHDLNPNGHKIKGYPKWPKYDNKRPKNWVFDGNLTSYVEPDTWRQQGIDIFIDGAATDFLH